MAESKKKETTKKKKAEVTEVVKDVEVKEAKPAVKKVEKTAKEAKVKLKNSEKKHSKKYREVVQLVEAEKEYPIEEAIDLAKKTTTTKFDSSVEVHIKLNVDIRNSEQQVRGSVTLPAGTGKNKIVCAIVSPAKAKEAKDAGAEFVGDDDLIAKIEKGWLAFEVVVATPDMMPKLGKIGKILGTKGLMPNPKTGTVTNDVAKVIKDIKKGMVEYRPDVTGIVHVIIGKVSFSDKDLLENYTTLHDAIQKARPSGVKGTYVKGISLATTMGPGIKVQM